MAEKLEQTRIALDATDLITPTETAKYQVGTRIKTAVSTTGAVKEYIYVKSHGALTAFVPYAIKIGSTAGAEVVTAAPTTLAAPGLLIGIPQVAFTSGYYGFIQIKGDAQAKIGAENHAIGDHLQVLNAGAVVVVDGTTTSTTESVNTCAISKEAGTVAETIDLYLKGEPAVIAGS